MRWCPSSGRHWVRCTANDTHHFWLTSHELARWTICPHCAGWWTYQAPASPLRASSE